jgi:hypothetical protein
MTEQRPAAPVDADKREHAMLDTVPFAGARRVSGFMFPTGVAAATVR